MKDTKSLFDAEIGEVNIIPVMSIEAEKKLSDIEMPEIIPILALRNAILFPSTVIPITVGRDKSIKLVRDAYNSSKIIGAASQVDVEIEDPTIIDLYDVGTLAKIVKIIEMPDGTITAILQGIKRFNIVEQTSNTPYIYAKVKYIEDIIPEKGDKEMKNIVGSIKDIALEIIKLSPHLPQESSFAIKNIEGDDFLINFIASSVELDQQYDKIQLLRENNIKARGLKLLSILNKQIEILKLKDDIRQKAKMEMNQQQREYYLNNQLRTIQEELGIDSDSNDAQNLREKAASKSWPDYVAQAFEKEIQKLERTNPSSPDYNIQYQYVQFIVDLPWDKKTKDNLDLNHEIGRAHV